MEDRQWEYCQVNLWEAKEHKGRFGKESGFGYDCRLTYFSTGGETVTRVLAQVDQILSTNPFHRVMGLLGLGGWELVTVQHGALEYAVAGVSTLPLAWFNAIAYFKRPMAPGRAIDEPQLVALDD